MSGALDTTFESLEKTGNEAAVAVLMAALGSKQHPIQEAALKALLGRHSPAAHRHLIRQWATLPERMKQIVWQRPGRLSGAMRDAILGADESLCENACDAVLRLREYDLLPALVTAVEDSANDHRELTGKTLFRLTELLYEDLAHRAKKKSRRDPHAVRQLALACLEASVERFSKHQRQDILEAFLLIVGRDNSTLKRILHNPHDRRFLATVDLLSQSQQPGIVRLLLSYLEDGHAPSSVLGILARRGDVEFIKRLLAKIGYEPSSKSKHNIKRITSIQWLSGDLGFLDDFDDAQQHAVVQFVMTSGVNRLESFQVIAQTLRNGKPAGRRAASQALTEFRGVDSNQLVFEKLNDDDPQVQASLLAQLRERGIAGALTHLIKMIDSPHEVVRTAARANLEEFSIDRFFAAYDVMDDEVRQSTGQLVKRVDPQTAPKIVEELRSTARSRRLRALGVAVAVGAVPEAEHAILPLLEEEDHFLRAEAATALGASNSDVARQALRAASSDGSFTVQEAAQQSLLRMDLDAVTDVLPAAPDAAIVPTEMYFSGSQEASQ